jgi:hypothetical protein
MSHTTEKNKNTSTYSGTGNLYQPALPLPPPPSRAALVVNVWWLSQRGSHRVLDTLSVKLSIVR